MEEIPQPIIEMIKNQKDLLPEIAEALNREFHNLFEPIATEEVGPGDV